MENSTDDKEISNPQVETIANSSAIESMTEPNLISSNSSNVVSSLKRAPSEMSFNPVNPRSLWERSQSDANIRILKDDATSYCRGTDDDGTVSEANNVGTSSKSTNLVSEQAMVYWNLHEAVEGETPSTGVTNNTNDNASFPQNATTNRSRLPSGNVSRKLVPIPQHEELSTRHLITNASTNFETKTEEDNHSSELHYHAVTNEPKFTSFSAYADVSRSVPSDMNLGGHALISQSIDPLPVRRGDRLSLHHQYKQIRHEMTYEEQQQGYRYPGEGKHFFPQMETYQHSVVYCQVTPSHLDTNKTVGNSLSNDDPLVNNNSPFSATPYNQFVEKKTVDFMSSSPPIQTGMKQRLSAFLRQIKSLMVHKDFLLNLASNPYGKRITQPENGIDYEQVSDTSSDSFATCAELIDSAWETDRELAFTMSNCVREEGLLDVIARLSSGIYKLLHLPSKDCKTHEEDFEMDSFVDDSCTLKSSHEKIFYYSLYLLSHVLIEDNCSALLQMAPYCDSTFSRQRSRLDNASFSSFYQKQQSVSSKPDEDEPQAPLVVHLVRLSYVVRKYVEWNRQFITFLQGFLKYNEATCDLIVRNRGLHTLIFSCRSKDDQTLRQVAMGLTNLALYARGPQILDQMTRLRVANWLYPLAVYEDPVVQYYACLCIAVLWTLSTSPGACLTSCLTSVSCATSKRLDERKFIFESDFGWCGTGSTATQPLAQTVQQSNTLSLVWKFVRHYTPSQFSTYDSVHLQGCSPTWLQRLLSVLACDREEVRTLAAFHFAMEARIKVNQKRASLFKEIEAIPVLHAVASSPHYLAAKFASEALVYLGESTPKQLSSEVARWKEDDVVAWVERIGFANLIHAITEGRIDGDLLLQMTETNLKEDLGLTNGLLRKRFQRELIRLKNRCSYSGVDSTGLCQWLQTHVGPEYVQYTYPLLCAGIDRMSLPQLLSCSRETVLLDDCQILNGVHRMKLLNVVKSFHSTNNKVIRPMKDGRASPLNRIRKNSPSQDRGTFSDVSSIVNLEDGSGPPEIDVFISYRRTNGCPLASLLKVHLELRNYSIFLDIEKLSAGQFQSTLMRSIQKARNFLLVLTPNALDRCQNDDVCHDWIHKEVVCALESKCNIIPVMDCFEWPPEESLPEDMKTIVGYNGVQWVHEYQDACIDKIEKFMHKQSPTKFSTFTSNIILPIESVDSPRSGSPTGE